ncbi:MAG: PEP-CTERM sorting domain-containing protein [Sedimentisphaerales bacterium]|nr:PEP-CTERM sorting domain-containing protein [Sedimentisphaerales bacterium]
MKKQQFLKERKMRPLRYLLIVYLTLYAAISVNANLSTYLITSSNTVSIGDTFTVDIRLGGATEPVGDYRIGVYFDHLLISDLTESTPIKDVFAGALGVPGTDTTAIWGVYENESLDIVRVAEISYWLQSSDLAALQSDPFTVATLYFLANNFGTIDFYVTSADIGGAGVFTVAGLWADYGQRLTVDETHGTSVSVVPEPTMLLLLGFGAAIVRKRKI